MAVAAWVLFGRLHAVFTQATLVGLVPHIVAGLAGGAVVAAVAPRHKVALAVAVGALLAALLLTFQLRHGFSHGSRPVLLWYWPTWLLPCFAIGGLLSRKVWHAV